MKPIPLVRGMLADRVWKAFLLGSIAAALTAVTTVEVRLHLEKKGFEDWDESRKAGVTLLAASSVTIFIYLTMYIVFGWGAGMLSPPALEGKPPSLFGIDGR